MICLILDNPPRKNPNKLVPVNSVGQGGESGVETIDPDYSSYYTSQSINVIEGDQVYGYSIHGSRYMEKFS